MRDTITIWKQFLTQTRGSKTARKSLINQSGLKSSSCNKTAVLNRIRRGDLNMENVNDNQRNQRQYHWAKKRGFIDKDMNILED